MSTCILMYCDQMVYSNKAGIDMLLLCYFFFYHPNRGTSHRSMDVLLSCYEQISK